MARSTERPISYLVTLIANWVHIGDKASKICSYWMFMSKYLVDLTLDTVKKLKNIDENQASPLHLFHLFCYFF